jgi:hypothetical protein
LITGAPALGADSVFSTWRGETVTSREGLIMLRVHLRARAGDNKITQVADAFQIRVERLSDRRMFILHVATGLTRDEATPLFKAPAGSYLIREMRTTYRGTPYHAVNLGVQRFVVKPMAIANFGNLVVKMSPPRTLLVKRIKGLKGLRLPKMGTDELVAVHDAFSGDEQRKLGRVALALPQPKTKDLTSSYWQTRKIKTTYALNLYKNNHLARTMMGRVMRHDAAFQQCYMDYMDTHEVGSGVVQLTFRIRGGENLLKVKTFNSKDIRNKKVLRCLILQAAQIEFAVKGTLAGALTIRYHITVQ